MDKRFLDKVIDQIVRETEIDNDQGVVTYPFSKFQNSIEICFKILSHPPLYSKTLPIYRFFGSHCKGIYGLNDEEIDYVWGGYIKIIKDKIMNNGL